MPGAVGEHEAALIGRKVAVRDVDGDALLTLRAQPVRQQRQIQGLARLIEGLSEAALGRGAGDRCELVAEDGLRIVEQ